MIKFCENCDCKTIHTYITNTKMLVCKECYVGSAELEKE